METQAPSNFKIEDKRIAFHNKLVTILGSNNVYFQPPPNIKLSYPCIIYHRVSGRGSNADNLVYNYRVQYELQYIDTDPREFIFEKLSDVFPFTTFDRTYVADRLYHNVYTIYI